MLGVFIAIFLKLFLLLGMGGLAQSAHSYDALNRLQAVSFSTTGNSISGEKLHTYHQYTYNDLDQRLRVNLADTSYWDYGFNSKGEVVMGSHKAANGNPLPRQQYGYAFDGIGNRTGASDGSSTSTLANSYTTNILNQYSSIQTSPIKHVIGKAPAGSPVTLNGNPTSREGAYYAGTLNADNTTPLWSDVSVSDGTDTVADNVYIPAASVAPVYDLDGNLSDDGRWSYTWDGGNRLVEMETTSAATTAGMPYARIVFVYDYQGRRIQREKYDSASAPTPSETTKYLYHGWNVVAELDATNAVLRKFVWGTDIDGGMQSAGGVGGLLWSEEANGDVHYYGYDGNGNVVVTVNASDGAKSSEYAYSPFGETIQATGVYAGTNRYRYSTKPQERESSLYYYGHRFLDVGNGRWLSKDPIEERGGVNLYGFVGNDGVNGVDVLGLDEWKYDSKGLHYHDRFWPKLSYGVEFDEKGNASTFNLGGAHTDNYDKNIADKHLKKSLLDKKSNKEIRKAIADQFNGKNGKFSPEGIEDVKNAGRKVRRFRTKGGTIIGMAISCVCLNPDDAASRNVIKHLKNIQASMEAGDQVDELDKAMVIAGMAELGGVWAGILTNEELNDLCKKR